ncbi:MAG: TROVE domain-containing protein [Bacteroidota bacterium]
MKFNTTKKKAAQTRNFEGAKAWKLLPKLELYSAVVTTSLSNSFYTTAIERVMRIRKLVAEVDPVFVAQLAVYAREQMHLRSVPLVLAVELAMIHQGDDLVRKTVRRIIQRADEITEILAYYQMANGRQGSKKLNRLSRQLQKGVADAFNHFDAYQFAKYNRKTEVSLRDALFLTHPKAKDAAQQQIFNQIIADQLAVPYTWEVELTRIGQMSFTEEKHKMEAVRNTWIALLESGKLGYMALMRNLRNILKADVGRVRIKEVATRLSDPAAVRRSKQLPFRFLAAYREIKELDMPHLELLLDALEQAILQSADNLPGFVGERILLASDVSGSMFQPISPKSKIQCYDIGLVLSMLAKAKSPEAITGIFGSRFATKELPAQSILKNVEALRSIEGEVGYATNGHDVIHHLVYQEKVVDKIMIFTDLQMWNSREDGNSIQEIWWHYKVIAPKAKLYLFDLNGYGSSPLKVGLHDVYLIAGWSDKIFEVLHALEQGEETLHLIEQIEI